MGCFRHNHNLLHVWLLIACCMQSALSKSKLSTEGRKFIVYPSHVDRLWDRIKIFVTTHSATPVQVRILTPLKAVYLGGVNENGTVQRRQPFVFEVNSSSSSSLDILNDGIVITADGDIAVFVNNPSSNASGVTSILSYDSLGTNYLFPSSKRPSDAQTSILIGSPEPGFNDVKITLPPGTDSPTLSWKNTPYGPGQQFTVRLLQNQFADIRQQDGTGTGDLTGTQIVATRKVTVFSAAVFYPSSSIGPGANFGMEKDITIENIPPVGSWGKSFVVMATPALSSGDYIRVIAGEANADVIVSNGSLVHLPRKGDFFETEILPGDSFTLESDRPIQVVQYRFQFNADSAPFMFLVPAIESYGVTFIVPVLFDQTNDQASEDYIVLVTHACFADRITVQYDLDPNNLLVSRMSTWKRVANTSYVTSQVKVRGQFITVAVQPSGDRVTDIGATVSGFFFGMGPKKAYAAPLGLHWQNNQQTTLQWTIPAYTGAEKPITDGKSSLVTRDKLPLALPLSTKYAKSRVACHRKCWIDDRCFYVAYKKQQGLGVVSDECILFGPTAECSGLVKKADYLLYKLDKPWFLA